MNDCWSDLDDAAVLACARAEHPALRSGAELDRIDPNALSPAERVDLLAVLEEQRRWFEAAQLRVLAAMQQHDTSRLGLAQESVSLALQVPLRTAQNKLAQARTLVTELPATLAAVAAGAISGEHARVLAEATWQLPDDPRLPAALEHAVLPPLLDGRCVTVSQLRQRVRRAAMTLDPATAEQRHQQALADRTVTYLPGEDGMASLLVTLGAPEAQLVFTRLAAAATLLPAADARTLDQQRADLVIDALLSGLPADALPTLQGRRPAIQVTVCADTLLGLNDQPAQLTGYGPITAHTARRLAADQSGTWRRLLTDPNTGALLDISQHRYRPPQRLRDYINARDQVCAFPTCNQPGYRCEYEHTTPFTHGGPPTGTTQHSHADDTTSANTTPAGTTNTTPTAPTPGQPTPTTTTPAPLSEATGQPGNALVLTIGRERPSGRMVFVRFPLQPKYARQYADLARLLVRYGRSDLVSGVGLDEFAAPLPHDQEADSEAEQRAAQLTADLERMGPTYIKFGQLLSTRVDLLPPVYTEALTRLQDAVEPFSFAEVESIVVGELGVSLSHGFASFSETPLAAASLAQVHRAELRSGRQVVVKVQRPGVREKVRQDMAALGELAEFADAHTDVGRRFGFTELLGQFRRSLAGELDYQREAANLVRISELLADHPQLIVPRPVPDYSTSSVLTMDYLPGRKLTEIGPLGRLDIDGPALVDELFRAYLQLILADGFFHADPHPGNLLLTPDQRIGLIDLGMVGTVTPQLQDQIVKLLLAISDGDGHSAATVLAGMGRPLLGYDEQAFTAAASELVSDAVGAGNLVQAGTVLVELSRLSGASGLRPPSEMAMIGKALLSLDRIAAQLDPDFVPAEAIRRHVAEIMRARMRSTPSSLLSAAMETKDFAAKLPGRINTVLDALAQGSFAIKVDALDEVQFLHVLQRLATRVTMGIVIAALVLGAALMMQIPTHSRLLGYPSIAIVVFGVAALAAAALLGSILLSDRRIARRSKAQHAKEE